MLDDVNLPLDNTRSERALRKIVVGRKAWMFYGSDTARRSRRGALQRHRLVPPPPPRPLQYLDEVLRVLPYWPRDRYLELAPKYWRATRARLRPEELAVHSPRFEIPPEAPASDNARPAVA